MTNGAGSSGASSWSSEEGTEAGSEGYVCKVHSVMQEHIVNLFSRSLTHSLTHTCITDTCMSVSLGVDKYRHGRQGSRSRETHSPTQATKSPGQWHSGIVFTAGEGPGSLIIWDKSTVGAILKTHHQQERALGQVIKSKAGCIVEGCAGQEALAARLMAAWPLSGK